jgi:beta-lactamase regulating signal transducer with metallopeptidase domain
MALFLALKKIFLFNPALAIGVARFQTDTGTRTVACDCCNVDYWSNMVG